MENNQSPVEILKTKKPWINQDNSIWLACSFCLRRNFEKFKFPNKLDTERKKQIVTLVGKDLLKIDALSSPKLYNAQEISIFEKEYLVEHFLVMQSFNQTGPGEAFVIDETGEIIISFNLADHISFYKLDSHRDLENTWMQLVKIESALGENLSYSFSPKFGFLTSNFDECGTALFVATYLHLPALLHTGRIESILEKEVDDNLQVMGFQGSPTEIIGDIFTIQNNYTLGLTEENIISSIRSITSKLIKEETNARLLIKEHQNVEIIDKVSRAFGILLYSYQIEAIEALNAISLCKFGAMMGWIEGLDEKDFNQLFFNCRRSHLLSQYSGINIPQEEIPHKRAQFIHLAFKNAKLLV